MVRYYAVKDLKVGFMSLQAFANDEVAKRAFMNAASDPASMLSKNPSDYELWFIGEFDESTGRFCDLPEFICNVGV